MTPNVLMWRKLGAWLWLATQNLEDFPGAARKLLNMIEWWVCLVMPTEEVDEMRRFRDLTEAQRALLLSATKSAPPVHRGRGARRYGGDAVPVACRRRSCSRSCRPSATEKARRAELMAADDITEVEAAVRIAAEIDAARGIGR